MVYRRRRDHVWTEHAINHVEGALESSGLQARVQQPPAICFVDLIGFTRLTEERGDEAAAQVAGRLVALVNDISRRRGGRPRQVARGRRDVLLPGARGQPWSPASTWSSAAPRSICHQPMWASTPARSSHRTETSTEGL
jgi:class 3 adenylate cyclase